MSGVQATPRSSTHGATQSLDESSSLMSQPQTPQQVRDMLNIKYKADLLQLKDTQRRFMEKTEDSLVGQYEAMQADCSHRVQILQVFEPCVDETTHHFFDQLHAHRLR
jgi:hypothetical protein